jgi:hypothetical protein
MLVLKMANYRRSQSQFSFRSDSDERIAWRAFWERTRSVSVESNENSYAKYSAWSDRLPCASATACAIRRQWQCSIHRTRHSRCPEAQKGGCGSRLRRRTPLGLLRGFHRSKTARAESELVNRFGGISSHMLIGSFSSAQTGRYSLAWNISTVLLGWNQRQWRFAMLIVKGNFQSMSFNYWNPSEKFLYLSSFTSIPFSS